MLTATSDTQPLPAGVEHRLQQFAQLVSARLANGQARAYVHALADKQAAPRHGAELAAREAPADEVREAMRFKACRCRLHVAVALRARRVDRDRGRRWRSWRHQGRDARPGAATTLSSVSGERVMPPESTAWPGCRAIGRRWRTDSGSRPAPPSRSSSSDDCAERSSSWPAISRCLERSRST